MPGQGINIFEAFANLFTEPVFEGVFPALLNDFFAPKRDISLHDESVRSFFTRRLSSKIADNIISAGLHGIYAGDIEKLSILSIMPSLWELEGLYGSVSKGMYRVGSLVFRSEPDMTLLSDLERRPPQSDRIKAAEAASMYTLKGGLRELARGLEASLNQNPMINIERKVLVSELRLKRNGPIRQV